MKLHKRLLRSIVIPIRLLAERDLPCHTPVFINEITLVLHRDLQGEIPHPALQGSIGRQRLADGTAG